MQNTLRTLLACSLVVAGFGVPVGWSPRAEPAAAATRAAAVGVVLEGDVESSHRCRLLILSDERTIVDRGAWKSLTKRQEVDGTFRFWEEQAGRVLYVYDDAQNLLCRVTNPDCVAILDVIE